MLEHMLEASRQISDSSPISEKTILESEPISDWTILDEKGYMEGKIKHCLE